MRDSSRYLPDAPGIERFYNFGVKLRIKTNQATICPNIMMLFMYIKLLVHLINH